MLDVNLHAPVTPQRLNPLLMPYSASSARLAELQLAAALDEQRAARSRAEAAQLLQILEMSQQHQQVPPPDDVTLPLGMTFKLAVAGMQASEDQYPESNQGTWQTPSRSSRTKHSKPAATGHTSVSKQAPSPHSGSDGWQHETGMTKLGSRQTLRTYLQKLRSEDPRCIFIVRRINKLGFRSKVLLEKHYSQFGQVAQVCVAHSKVKPLPNAQGTHPRTRPGNFGLVVMRDPEAVKRVLQQGTPQNVMGFKILVYRFEQHELEKEVMDQEEEDGEGSFEPERRNFQIGQEDWNRQGSSSSNGSNGSGQANAAKHAVDWQRFRDEQAAAAEQALRAQAAAEQALRAQAVPHAQTAPQAMPGSLPADNILEAWRLSLQEIQELQQLGRVSRGFAGVPQSSAVAAPPGSLMLPCGDSLQGIAKDPYSYTGEPALQDPYSYTGEPPLQAVHFAQLQEHVGRLHGECQQKMAELSAVATAAAMMQPPPAPGLVPAAPSSVGNSGLGAPARTLSTPVAPWLHGAASIPAVPVPQAAIGGQHGNLGALTVLQAQQLVNTMQAQLTASRGSGLSLPPAAPATWPLSGLMAAAAAGPAAAGSAPAVCQGLQDAATATFSSLGPGSAAAPTSQAQSYEGEQFLDDDYSIDFPTDTLRNHLRSLKDEDPRRIFIARRINKLGFKSAEIVQQHFTQYGNVRCVLVAHSKVKPWLSQNSSFRVRPGSLGIIVMEDIEGVKQILALGEKHIIAGHTTIVQRFSKPMFEEEDVKDPEICEQHHRQQKYAYESSTAAGTTDSHGKSEDSSNSTPSDPCEKSDGDGSNSGQDGFNSSQESPGLYQSGFARRTPQPAPEPRRQTGMAHTARSGARNGGVVKRQHA